MKIDPFVLKRPQYAVQTREIAAEDTDQIITVSLRPLDVLGAHANFDLIAEYRKKYITGDPIMGEEPASFPALGGEPVHVSENLIANVANLVGMQADAKEDGSKNDEIYSFDEWIAIAVNLPSIWMKVLTFAADVQQMSERQKKTGGTDTAQRPPLPSSTSTATPSLSDEPTRSSAPSTTDSAPSVTDSGPEAEEAFTRR